MSLLPFYPSSRHTLRNSLIPTPRINPSRRSLNHTLFVSRRPRSTQLAQEKGVYRARKPILVLAAFKLSGPHLFLILVHNRSFAPPRPRIDHRLILLEISVRVIPTYLLTVHVALVRICILMCIKMQSK